MVTHRQFRIHDNSGRPEFGICGQYAGMMVHNDAHPRVDDGFGLGGHRRRRMSEAEAHRPEVPRLVGILREGQDVVCIMESVADAGQDDILGRVYASKERAEIPGPVWPHDLVEIYYHHVPVPLPVAHHTVVQHHLAGQPD